MAKKPSIHSHLRSGPVIKSLKARAEAAEAILAKFLELEDQACGYIDTSAEREVFTQLCNEAEQHMKEHSHAS